MKIVALPFPEFPGLQPGQHLTGQVDYDLKKVEWNEYEFPDGLTVRVLSLPLNVYSTNIVDPSGMPGYIILWNNLVRVVAQEKHLGKPTSPIPPNDLPKVPKIDLRPLTSSEDWNEFELKDGHTLREKTVVSKFRRVKDAFDSTGSPMIIIDAQQVVSVVLTESSAGE